MKVAKYLAGAMLLAIVLTVAGRGVFLWHEGYRLYAVQTGSMTPTYPTGALVVDAPVKGQSPAVGDVITFRTSDGLVTHRVHGTVPQGIKTKGDANRTPDPWTVKPHNVIGLVSWGVAGAGYAFVYFQQPAGVASLLLLLVSMVFAWSLFFAPSKQEPLPA